MRRLHGLNMTRNLQPDDRLGDFTADRRILTLTGMAALIGVISAFVALALLRLIGFFTHLFYYHAIDSRLVSDRKSTRLNSSHLVISYAVFCLKKKKPL